MVFTLEDVVSTCINSNNLDVTGEDEDFFLKFVKRDVNRNEYDINFEVGKDKRKIFVYYALMVDKLLLFAYFTGKVPITTIVRKNTILILKDNDLYALKASEIVKKMDTNLSRLHDRINRRKSYGDMYANLTYTWSKLLTDVGKDEEVEKHLGKIVTEKMVTNCESPYVSEEEKPIEDAQPYSKKSETGRKIYRMMTKIHPVGVLDFYSVPPSINDSHMLIMPVSNGVDMQECFKRFREEITRYANKIDSNIGSQITFGRDETSFAIENRAPEGSDVYSLTHSFLRSVQLLIEVKMSEKKYTRRV